MLYNIIFMAENILVRGIPPEVYKEILKEQARILQELDKRLSLDRVIICMIKDYVKCRKQSQ